VNGLAFAPDGHLLASCSNDRNPRLWAVESGELLAELKGHDHYAIRPAFHPDGTLLATIGWDGLVRLWAVPQ
jgi:WD40 repeat protein